MTREETQALLVEFFKWAVREGPWNGCDLDGGSVQDKAESLGLIVKTTFDSSKHDHHDFQDGDDWYEFAPALISREEASRTFAVASDCRDENSCARHAECMYLGCSAFSSTASGSAT